MHPNRKLHSGLRTLRGSQLHYTRSTASAQNGLSEVYQFINFVRIQSEQAALERTNERTSRASYFLYSAIRCVFGNL